MPKPGLVPSDPLEVEREHHGWGLRMASKRKTVAPKKKNKKTTPAPHPTEAQEKALAEVIEQLRPLFAQLGDR